VRYREKVRSLFKNIVNPEEQQSFQALYHTGKLAFERGRYRQSIEALEAALTLLPPTNRLAGEAQIWLVTAYQAAGQTQDAIALCQSLQQHPSLTIRSSAKRLLEILKAPVLKRPKEWMTEIPDLANMDASRQDNRYVAPKKRDRAAKEPNPDDYVDLAQVDTSDNGFVWLALGVGLLVLGSLWFFGVAG
jgi:tetratricopeptide (TPR) repeat protein